jgi:hypothetical protein
MKPQFFRTSRTLAAGAIAAAALAACGGGGDDTPAPAPAPAQTAGTIAVSAMTDAPTCGLDEVNVSISKIRFHQDFQAAPGASGWVELNFAPAKKLNLLNLASVLSGVTTSLGEQSVPTGIYTQMRLVLDTAAGANTIKATGASAAAPLVTAATLGSDGLKMPIDLRIDANQKGSVVFDFDACNSVQPSASTWLLRPMARVVPTALNGISGYIDKAALSSGVVVTAQQGGIVFTSTAPNPTTGEFMLPRLAAGRYDVVITAKGRATTVLGQVPVDAASTVAVSTVAAPVVLATSATSTISGRVNYATGKTAPDTGTWVAASQSINANSTLGNPTTVVTTRIQPVDQATGNYTLNDLPRVAVGYALYKPALPLVQANATTVPAAGRYKVEGVATGYSRVTTFGTNSSGVPIATATTDVNASAGNVANVNITFY